MSTYPRLILVGLGALVAAGIAVGLLVSWVSTQALEAAGIDGTASEGEATASSPTAPSSTGPTTGPTAGPTTTTTGPPTAVDQGTVAASPLTAGSFEQVTLSGRLPGVAPGTTLQVERRENGTWVAFPTTATTGEAGTFSTFVELGQPGANVLRLSLPGSTRSTPTVTIIVG